MQLSLGGQDLARLGTIGEEGGQAGSGNSLCKDMEEAQRTARNGKDLRRGVWRSPWDP